ncbi:multisubunit sodium/proton antiporter, MrpG subunit [Natronoarchaeum philippinense]|uniref:Multisubunit sodium/proton antiporter, MrpG subunit n=1 Tax=Natronoarchaeum philippinense TaxID=558529 RepID=A0A285N1E2_NATPI|nr:monovalent cation/H(+) antiporter subunit G [Natronoarchaeum philippinense]SNZ02607.1 multisubunit sodium/proton antiporter, MrpG subunit [Natronoarchaeum philippinense]
MSAIETARLALVGLLLVGSLFFTLVSTVGVLRLPDIYSRAHTASQADTLGAGFALAAVAVVLGLQPTTAKTVLLLLFIFLTNPTAAHAIARAADEDGIEPWTADDDRTAEDLAPDHANTTESAESADAADRDEGGEPA